jgi:hypothetical protein
MAFYSREITSSRALGVREIIESVFSLAQFENYVTLTLHLT